MINEINTIPNEQNEGPVKRIGNIVLKKTKIRHILETQVEYFNKQGFNQSDCESKSNREQKKTEQLTVDMLLQQFEAFDAHPHQMSKKDPHGNVSQQSNHKYLVNHPIRYGKKDIYSEE